MVSWRLAAGCTVKRAAMSFVIINSKQNLKSDLRSGQNKIQVSVLCQ